MTDFIVSFEDNEKAETVGKITDSYWEKARRGMLFEKDSLWGLKDTDGKILFTPKYSFIGKCKDNVLFIEPNWSYMSIRSGCCETGYMLEEERPYLNGGKAGLIRDGKILLPAEYEYFSKKFDDTYHVVKGGKEMYIDSTGQEVLTRVRRFDDENPNDSPFWLHVNDIDIFTLIKFIGQADSTNPNVIKLNGEWVELERYCRDELMEMLLDHKDDLRIKHNDLSLFKSDFSYEYTFYMAQASGKNPLRECMSQLKKMGAFCNSWYYVIKIWQAAGEHITASDLREFDKKLRKTEILGAPLFAIGHSDELKSGEVKMLFITFYHERCFPSHFEYEWSEMCRNLPITELKNSVQWLKDEIDQSVFEEYQYEVYKDQLLTCITGLKFYEGMTWDNIKDAVEFFYDQGSPIRGAAILFLKAMKNNVYNDAAYDFFLNAAEWALERGDDINSCLGKCSSLDYIWKIREKRDSESIRRLQDKLIRKGAKTYKEILDERNSNKDYFKELENLRNRNPSDKEMPSLVLIK